MADAPVAVLETALYVDDLDAAERFYCSVLGLELVSRHPTRQLFLRVAGGVLILFVASETDHAPSPGGLPVPSHGATGPGHVCFAADTGGLAAWLDRLAAAGVPVEADFVWPNGARSIYFRDPAGNSLEVAERRLWGV